MARADREHIGGKPLVFAFLQIFFAQDDAVDDVRDLIDARQKRLAAQRAVRDADDLKHRDSR